MSKNINKKYFKNSLLCLLLENVKDLKILKITCSVLVQMCQMCQNEHFATCAKSGY